MLAEGKKTLEAVFTKLGLEPSKLLQSEAVDPEGGERIVYRMQRGSADVIVALAHASGRTYVRVVAPVVTPPADAAARARLFEHVLELNAKGLQNAAFGLSDGTLIVVSERPAAGLDPIEFEQMLAHLSAVADTFDDRLARDFGGTLANKR